MGACPSKVDDVVPSSPSNPHPIQRNLQQNFDPGPSHSVTHQDYHNDPEMGPSGLSTNNIDKEDSQMFQDWLGGFQEKNFQRMITEIQQDKNMFILNNLLMTIQFFRNFDEALDHAEKFRIEKELEMNTGLRSDDSIGRLRVTLLHGMGIELAKNYVYRPQKVQKTEFSNSTAASLGLDNVHANPIVSEDILPLEFFVAFENFCIHTERQYDDLMNIEDGIGVHRNTTREGQQHGGRDNCLCMQEDPEMKGDKIRKGYVRLYNELSPRHRNLASNKGHRGSASTDFSFGRDSDIAESTVTATTSSSANRNRSSFDSEEADYVTRQFSPGKTFAATTTKPLESIQEILERSSKTNSSTRSVEESTAQPQAHAFSPSVARRRQQQSKKFHDPHDLPSSGYGTSQASTSTSASHAAIAQMKARRQQATAQAQQNKNIQSPSLPPECFTEVLIENDEEEEEIEKNDETDSEEEEEKTEEKNSRRSSMADADDDFIRKRYLNPAKVCTHFEQEFEKIAKAMGIPFPDLADSEQLKQQQQQIQMDGATIRLYDEKFNVENNNDSAQEQKKIKILQTFTASLQSEQLPRKLIFSLIHRPSSSPSASKNPKLGQSGSHSGDDDLRWPGKEKIQSIAHDLGCHLIPLPPSRKKLTPNSVNQPSKIPPFLEWKTSFCQGENLLLNSLTHAHWRSYMFAALLFKNFVSPSSSSSSSAIGLEQIRNLLFQMWDQDFLTWSDEKGGHHLVKFLDKLYDCLGTKKMANYFIPGQNMLRHAPRENIYLVQGLLSKVRENLAVHCIVALTNLREQQSEDNFFPKFDLNTLYRLMTVPGGQGELIHIVNPKLKHSAHPPPSSSSSALQNGNSRKSQKKSKNSKKMNEQNAEFSLPKNPPMEKDEGLERTRRRYQKWEEREQKRKAAEAQLQKQEVVKIPAKSKKDSSSSVIKIELDKLPVANYTNLRMVTIIELFINHFLKMAANCIGHKAWAEATMYVMHVQNLCRLLQNMELARTRMDEMQIAEFLRETNELMTQLGPKVQEYLSAKISKLGKPDEDSSSTQFLQTKMAAAAAAAAASSIAPTSSGNFSGDNNNNFYFSANSMSSFSSSSFASPIKNASRRPQLLPRLAESLHSLPHQTEQILTAYQSVESPLAASNVPATSIADYEIGDQLADTFGNDSWTSQLGQRIPRVRSRPEGSLRPGGRNRNFEPENPVGSFTLLY